MGYLNEIFSHC